MDIRGVPKIRTFLSGIIDARQKSVNASNDRDAHQNPHERRQTAKLTREQVAEAFKNLVKSLGSSGLEAEHLETPDGDVFVVKDASQNIIRQLRGMLITDLYFDGPPIEGQSSGTLLKRSA